MSLQQAKVIGEQLENVCVDNNDEIDEKFVANTGYVDVTFDKGTPKIDIWLWIEERFDVSVAVDLMGLGTIN